MARFTSGGRIRGFIVVTDKPSEGKIFTNWVSAIKYKKKKKGTISLTRI